MKFKLPMNSRGFTLLFAAIIASVVLSLGAAIFDISIKQVELSSASRESQYAFYAADTAANCALYWDERTDIHPNTFATSSSDTNSASSLTCDGQSASLSVTGKTSTTGITQFTFAPNGYCAQVTVTKTQVLGSGGITTEFSD